MERNMYGRIIRGKIRREKMKDTGRDSDERKEKIYIHVRIEEFFNNNVKE
jgi:hypothetical protein